MNEVVVDNLTLKVPANIFEYRHFTYLRLDSFTFAMLGQRKLILLPSLNECPLLLMIMNKNMHSYRGRVIVK